MATVPRASAQGSILQWKDVSSSKLVPFNILKFPQFQILVTAEAGSGLCTIPIFCYCATLDLELGDAVFDRDSPIVTRSE